MMLALTPAVEPLSIDEAFLDLSGTARLHGMSPAKALARFAAEVENKLRITVSIGLSCNKFLAKVASDLDKPRGFAVLSAKDAPAFLASKPVSFIFGVGAVSAARYARDGFHRIADLQRAGEIELMRRYGEEGRRLSRLSRGIDERKVDAGARNQERIGGNHFRERHRRFSNIGTHFVEPVGGGFGAAETERIRRRHGDAEAQDGGFQNPYARAIARNADATCRTHLCRRPHALRARNRWHAISLARRRDERA